MRCDPPGYPMEDESSLVENTIERMSVDWQFGSADLLHIILVVIFVRHVCIT